MTELIAYLPEQLHVAMTSRTDPPLPLVGLRARKEMRELRTRDLRFTTSEAQVLLEGTAGRPLSHETVTRLEEATEGWAVGLRLAALSLRNVAQVDDFALQFRRRAALQSWTT